MKSAFIGSLDAVDALSFLGSVVLVGTGKNPTTGWSNWFEPERQEDHYAFKQEAPSEPAADVIMPFLIMNIFPLRKGVDKVYVRQNVGGKETEIEIPVRLASIIETSALKSFIHGPGPIEGVPTLKN